MKDKLPPNQARFVDEYLIDLNATQAAIRAGYSKKTAGVQGPRLLGNVRVAAAIAEAKAKRSARVAVSADKVLTELAHLGFANMADYMKTTPEGDPRLDFSNLSREQTAALVEVTVEDFTEGRGDDARDVRRVKFKLADKRAALVDIGKHLGMFIDKQEHSGPGGAPLVPDRIAVQLVAPK